MVLQSVCIAAIVRRERADEDPRNRKRDKQNVLN